jgi:hypothetical protein
MHNSMAKFSKGILGGFTGTVGTVVGGYWRGIEYMRSRSNRRNFTSSQKQKEQQLKFGLLITFQQSFNSMLNRTFDSFAVKMTGANSALSYNLRNAVGGTYPEYTVNYSKFLMSRGNLPNALNPAATAGANRMVNFTWTDNSGSATALASDQAHVVLYCEAMRQSVISATASIRSEEATAIDVSAFAGQTVETWLFFISENDTSVATSIHTGSVIVS